jgi:ABC-2 type transport system ATP-binding protein
MNVIEPTVEVKNLYKNFGTKNVLKGISFEVYPGEIFVLLGPNGAGKTTTVKIISGVLETDKGEVFVLSEKVSVLNTKFKKYIGYLPDEPYVYNKLTGKEFIEFILSIYETKIENERYSFFLKQFELEEVINLPIENYSKGMKQKLLLMSIFLRNPKVYILDEPLIGLDPKSISFFKKYLLDLAKEGKTIILCTHLLELAEQLATKINIIYGGRILTSGTKEELSLRFNISTTRLEDIYLYILSNYT